MTATTVLDPRWAAVRAGLSSGWIESRQALTEPAGVIGQLFFPVMYALELVWMRGKTVPGTHFALGARVLPSLLGMSIAFGGLAGPATAIAYCPSQCTGRAAAHDPRCSHSRGLRLRSARRGGPWRCAPCSLCGL